MLLNTITLEISFRNTQSETAAKAPSLQLLKLTDATDQRHLRNQLTPAL
jgi:hypothetical protein